MSSDLTIDQWGEIPRSQVAVRVARWWDLYWEFAKIYSEHSILDGTGPSAEAFSNFIGYLGTEYELPQRTGGFLGTDE